MSRIVKNISNNFFLINDLGITLEPNEEVDLDSSLDFHYIERSKDLFLAINNKVLILKVGTAIITNGEEAKQFFSVITNRSYTDVYIKNIILLNPTQADFFITANMLSLAFASMSETALRGLDCPNTFVFWGNEFNKIKTLENATLTDDRVILSREEKGGSSIEYWENIQALEIITKNSDQATISTTHDSSFIYQANSSIEIKRSVGGYSDKFIFLKKESATDWSEYTSVKSWVYGNNGEEICFYINSEFVPGSKSILKDGWQELNINIDNFYPRHQITNYGFGFTPKTAKPPYSTYISGVRCIKEDKHHSSGYFNTHTIETLGDIESLFVYSDQLIPEETEIIYKISIDDGEHWHILSDNELNNWTTINEWEEEFNIANRLRIMVELKTEDKTSSPVIKHFFVMYKLR